MYFFKPTRGKLLIITIGSLLLWLAIFSIWKPYLGTNQTCMRNTSCLDNNSDRPLRSNLFNPGIQIAYLWKTLIIYPQELLEIGKIASDTFKKSPVDAFYAVSDYIIQQEKNRTFKNIYSFWQIILLILYWYFLVCLFMFLIKKRRFVFLVPIIIALGATIYSLIFFTEYLADIMLSFLPYWFVGNIIAFFMLTILLWPWLFGDRKCHGIITIFLWSILISPIIFASVFGVKYFDFYKTDIISLEVQENPLKVLSANIYVYNKQTKNLKELIIDQNPDLLILTEYNSFHEDGLETFLGKNYPYKNERIFSRYPLTSIKNGPKYVHININKDGEIYDLYTIHTTAPMNPHNFIARNNQIKQLATEIGNDLKKNSDNIIIAGDFNVTPRSYYYNPLAENFDEKLINITRADLENFTWRDARIPFFQSHIDYVWVSKNMKIGSVDKITIPGSDHDGFIFEVK